MRLLHVSGGLVYGGIERMLATLASTKSSAVSQHFAVSQAGQLWPELRAAGAQAVLLPSARASRPLSVWRARRAFDRQLAAASPDAAIFHGSWTHAMFAPVARHRGCRVAFWQHTPILNARWPDRIASWTKPEAVIANSRFTATAPVFPGVRTRVIFCPVAPPCAMIAPAERAAARRSLGASDSDVVVLMASRLEAGKGHLILIEAASRLRQPDVFLWIAAGVQRAEEQAYARQLEKAAAAGGARVAFLGHRNDVPALMQLADIYCQPNQVPEPFGVAIAEAMSAGRACIVSRAGGAAELVDAACGVLTEPGDVEGVAAALRSLAADRERREAMGRAAAVRAAELTDPVQRLEDVASFLSAHADAR